MDIAEKVLEIMRAEGQPLNAGKIAELGGLDRKDVDKVIWNTITDRRPAAAQAAFPLEK